MIPPLLKQVAGPLLGPALLARAARQAGFRTEVADLNAEWIRERVKPNELALPTGLRGDHDKPPCLQRVQDEFESHLAEHLQVDNTSHDASPVLTLLASFEDVERAIDSLLTTAAGRWLERRLRELGEPDVVCLSVMWSGQVIYTLMCSKIARRLWPDVKVVWGGAHVTALRDAIDGDPRYNRDVDCFVVGYAEGNFAQVVERVHAGTCGRVEYGTQVSCPIPAFDNLELYGTDRLTLPVQSSRGCIYGLCTFCTYVAIEGKAKNLDLRAVAAVVDQAAALNAVVSFKDSLVSVPRLKELADLINGRVEWSACTKMSAALNRSVLEYLAARGCRTLEFGVETFVEQTQASIQKKQSFAVFESILDGCADAGISVVVNYMYGFPNEDRREWLRWFRRVQGAIRTRNPRLHAVIQKGALQLERLSAMAREADQHGIRILRAWPWASVLEWEAQPLAAPRRTR